MDLPRILVLGDAGVGKHSLISLVTGTSLPRGQQQPHTWLIDNKYYTAEVAIEVSRTEAAGGPPLLAAADYEAVLLVFDAMRQASFASLKQWWEKWGAEDVPIKLAVAAKADCLEQDGEGAAVRPAWLEAAAAWCAEQLIEYVESSTEQTEQAAPAKADAQQRGWVLDEEPSGVERIVEALQANMWPGMRMKADAGRRSASTAAAGGMSTSYASSGEASADESLHAIGTRVHPAAGDSGALAGRPAGHAEDFDLGAYLLRGEDLSAAAAVMNGSGGSEGLQADAEVEQEMQHMEQLFTQLASSRDRLQQLPDDQRRQAAAAMVSQLMEALGLDEEDSEGGLASSSDSEEEGAEEATVPCQAPAAEHAEPAVPGQPSE